MIDPSSTGPVDLRGLVQTLEHVCPLDGTHSYAAGRAKMVTSLRSLGNLSGAVAEKMVSALEGKDLVRFRSEPDMGRGCWRYARGVPRACRDSRAVAKRLDRAMLPRCSREGSTACGDVLARTACSSRRRP